MTPTEVWEGFVPVKDNLETSIISSEEHDNLVKNKIFFTSEKTASGRTRVYAEIYYDRRWSDNRAAIILAPPIKTALDCSVYIGALLKEGYLVCYLDYAGKFDDSVNHTSFAPEVSPYAAYPECLNHMDIIETDARHTPWFEWTKIMRRAISLLQEQRLVAKDRIGIIGLGTGAQLAWQTAGIDGRVRAVVPVNGGGYLWTSRLPGATYIPSTDQERIFSSGVGAETYARFVTCPTCFVVSSNSSYFNADKAGDLIASVPSQIKRLIISIGTNVQISKRAFDGVINWLRDNFAHDGMPMAAPTLHFEKIEDKLYLRLDTKTDAEKVQIFVCHGEPYSAVRYWQEIKFGQKTAQFELTYPVSVLDKSSVICAYATLEYPNGALASTAITIVTPQKIGITLDEGANLLYSKLIYNGEMGLGAFSASTGSALFDENVIQIKQGPLGIKGVSVNGGELILYRRAYAKQALSAVTCFQFDVYSADKNNLTLKILAADLKSYSATVPLTGGEFWQRVILLFSDFKNELGKPLQRFDDGKLFTFVNASGMIFNNILWI